MNNNHIIIYTDGGSRGNPGKAAYGFVIYNENLPAGRQVIYGEGSPIGIATNNIAEYEAILKSFEWLKANREKIGRISGITMRMDSLLACQQLKGIYKVKSTHLAEYLRKIKKLELEMNIYIKYEHVTRDKNVEADLLVNRALDENATIRT